MISTDSHTGVPPSEIDGVCDVDEGVVGVDAALEQVQPHALAERAPRVRVAVEDHALAGLVVRHRRACLLRRARGHEAFADAEAVDRAGERGLKARPRGRDGERWREEGGCCEEHRAPACVSKLCRRRSAFGR
eukprot:1844048-Prymnesium_polylepis.2